MKKHFLFFLVTGSFLFLSATYSPADETLYVQPFKARIFAKPSLSADILGQVDSGYQLVSSGKEGTWQKVTFKGKQGYIPAVQTAKTPPLGKSAALAAESAPKLGARARASSSSAVVAGMKGLAYEDRARFNADERSDYESLQKVESLILSPDELKAFQSEGGKQ